ncbi:hypothetical protein A0H81_05918 [Grifola frondosa]|uniref:F-box domain-containing protein n=1 Tax=Grifola frondosa TaxID=5627 RepID=A0A1C7MCS6_GRIFR|nr:hypothetical protein A0H81_05918 [Grifola frondosa]
MSLHLEYPSDSQFSLEEEKPSMLDFLQTLTSCPDLKYLMVSGVIQGLEPAGDTSYLHLNLRLSLLKLHKLVTWNDYSIDAVYLLTCISTSPFSMIEVHVNFTTVDFDGIMEPISTALPIESDRSEMSIFSAVQNLELEFYTDRLVVQAAGINATPSLSISFWDLDGYDVHRHIVPVLGKVSELFPVSHVQSLKIVDDTRDFEPVGDVIEPSWWGSMHHFQSFRRLHIVSSQEYAIQGVFQAMDLSSASTADSNRLICPNLKVINLDTSFQLEDVMFEEMVSIIQHRASLGSRLKRFKVINDINCAPPDGDNWEKLKENVGDLDYIRIILPQVLEGHVLKL